MIKLIKSLFRKPTQIEQQQELCIYLDNLQTKAIAAYNRR